MVIQGHRCTVRRSRGMWRAVIDGEPLMKRGLSKTRAGAMRLARRHAVKLARLEVIKAHLGTWTPKTAGQLAREWNVAPQVVRRLRDTIKPPTPPAVQRSKKPLRFCQRCRMARHEDGLRCPLEGTP